MIYTPLIQKAMKYAYDAHHGQTDQSGVPYIFHSFYVAEKVSEEMPEEIPVCVALLHDVVEDTDITLKQIEKEFPKEVTETLALLTHNPNEDYFTYIRNLKKDPVATQVKIMDLYHNMDESRLEGVTSVTEEQREWWHKKYNRALGILLGSNLDEDGTILDTGFGLLYITQSPRNPDEDGIILDTDVEIQRLLKEVSVEDQQFDVEFNHKPDRLFRPMSDSEIYQKLDRLRKEILPYGEKIMAEHRFEVFAAIERMLQVLEIAAVFGLDRLEREGKKLAESDSELERFLAMGLDTGALENWSSMYDMFQIYDGSERCLWMDLIRYIYLRGVMMMTSGINSRMGKEIFLSLLPEQERILYEKYQRNKN